MVERVDLNALGGASPRPLPIQRIEVNPLHLAESSPSRRANVAIQFNL